MLSPIQGNPTNLEIVFELVKIHKFIYGRWYIMMMAKYLECFQKGITIQIKLSESNIHRRKHLGFKGRQG